MKMYWSAFLSLLLLLTIAGCSQEQFGGTPSTESNSYQGPQVLEQSSCSTYTLVKPKVDILYVVDNSSSTFYVSDDIKTSIKNTINSISAQFDYRVVGTNLLSSNTQFSDYQVFSNSSDISGLPSGDRRLSSPNDFSFFDTKSTLSEAGIDRVHDFMNAQVSTGLFRKGAYHLVILISNGFDERVEWVDGNIRPKIYCADGSLTYPGSCPGQTAYDVRKQKFNSLKSSAKLNSQQFRLFAVTAASPCKIGWNASENSYRRLAQELYSDSGATDSSTMDRYDLCGTSISSIFSSVNSAIQQVTIPHKYHSWPITFASNTKSINEVVGNVATDVKVYKYVGGTGNRVPVTNWSYYENTSYPTAMNTSTVALPTGTIQSDPVSARHFVKFGAGSEIVHPDCVLIQSQTKTEYFGYVVAAQKPDLTKSVVIRINGIDIPQSSTNGWSYSSSGQPATQNIKMAYPNAGDENPPVIKSGFMFKLNGVNNYYKSGDAVQIYYSPAAI